MITIKKKIISKNINDNDLVFDIETTGFDFKRDKLVLLGLVKKIKGSSYIIQYFAEKDSEEIRLLKIYLKEVKDKRLISFNGDTFDIGFLNSRLEAYELMPYFPEKSLDIYRLIKKNSKFFHYDSMKLTDIEKLIGIDRDDPSRYKTISKLTDDIKIRDNPYPILKHNENDLIATEALANIEEIYKKKLSISTKIGKIYLEYAIINKDLANFSLKADNDLKEAFIAENNYQLTVKARDIRINLHVLYGYFDDNISGHVAINPLKIKNNSDIEINENLLIIREKGLYNYKNILNLCKKIIENYY